MTKKEKVATVSAFYGLRTFLMIDSFHNIENLVRRIVQSVNGAGSDSQTQKRNATSTSNANAPAEGSELNPEEELYEI